MEYKTDIEIAQACKLRPIGEIAARAHVDEKYLEQYGRYKAKVDPALLRESNRENGKLVLVTAITPTPAGEGKTTTTIGLADGLKRIGKDVTVALREPSLGPVFGIKGGAAGGGYAQVVPMEDINLHFTGDFHAIGAANNLLAAMLDNHIQQGNSLHIDPRRITWKRCVDMNDRQLRFVVDGLGGKPNGTPREDGFDITVASEIMAVFCLASSITAPTRKSRSENTAVVSRTASVWTSPLRPAVPSIASAMPTDCSLMPRRSWVWTPFPTSVRPSNMWLPASASVGRRK